VALFALTCIALVSFLSETVVGFGSTILAVTMGANFYPIHVLLPVIVPVNLLLSIYLVTRHHDAIDLRVLLRRILPFMGLGMPIGLFIFTLRENRALQIGFAAFVLVLAGLELYRLLVHHRRPTRPLPFVGGALLLLAGGVIHGIYGSGGPMAVYFTSREIHDKRRFRSTLSLLWLLLNIVLLCSYAATGVLTLETAKLSLVLLAPLVVALVAGEIIHGRVQERPFRVLVYLLLLGAGGILLQGAVRGG